FSGIDEAPLFIGGAGAGLGIDSALVTDVVQVHAMAARLIHDLKDPTPCRPENPAGLSGVIAAIGGLYLGGPETENFPAFGSFIHITASEGLNVVSVRIGILPDRKLRLAILPAVLLLEAARIGLIVPANFDADGIVPIRHY